MGFTRLKRYPSILKMRGSREERPTTGFSASAATRLKKRIGRMGDIQMWLDFTFADDVMSGTVTERAEYSATCMNYLMTWLHEQYNGAYLVWRREWQPRKSGQLRGQLVPHFHVMIGGLSKAAWANYEATSIRILAEWVHITRTRDPNAILVALHRDPKTGEPSCYRKIESMKHAIRYVSKYFSKDEKPPKIPAGESIGRCWGYSRHCPDYPPVYVYLTREMSIRLREHFTKKTGAKPSALDTTGLYEQLNMGYSTYIWEDWETMMEWITGAGLFLEGEKLLG